ncbi:MAG TPA: DHHA1 domain-containing protein, partial [Phycisphaerae bacterium]|nr:DHHA1 domain-containing protein [Phycisphaerae bacterium]
PDGLIAYSTASHEEITGAGCGPADIDEQVAIPRSLKGIRMAILFTEGKPGRVRINFRGEGGTNVLELARELGGGGHATSAGAIVNGSLPQVVPDVLERAARRLRS